MVVKMNKFNFFFEVILVQKLKSVFIKSSFTCFSNYKKKKNLLMEIKSHYKKRF